VSGLPSLVLAAHAYRDLVPVPDVVWREIAVEALRPSSTLSLTLHLGAGASL